MSKYDSNFCGDPAELLGNMRSAEEAYSFTVGVNGDEELVLPTVKECVKYMRHLADEDEQDKITKACISDKIVNLYKGKEKIVSFSGSRNLSWDFITELKEHPLAIMMMQEVCAAFVIKKSTGSLKNTPTTATPKLQSRAEI